MLNVIKIEETKDCVSVVEWFVEWLNFIVDKNNRTIIDSNKNKINWTNRMYRWYKYKLPCVDKVL
jgi:hypothetical protein